MLKPGLIDLCDVCSMCKLTSSHFLELINMVMKFQIHNLKACIDSHIQGMLVLILTLFAFTCVEKMSLIYVELL